MKDKDKTREQLIELKRIEEALTENDSGLRQITDNMLDMISLTDKEGIYQYVSPSHESVLGYEPGDLFGKSIFDFVHPDDLDRVASAVQTAISNSSPGNEYRYRHANGQYIWLETVGNLLFDSNSQITGAVFAGRDITNRKQAEEGLQTAHQQLLDIIDFLPDATFVIDQDKKVIAWNRAIEEMSGVRKEDIIGKGDYTYAVPFYGKPRPVLIDLIVPGNSEAELQYERVERKGNKLFVEAFIPLIFNGKGAFLWSTASPLFNSNGNLVGAIQSIRDITEHKQIERKLRYLSLHDPLTGLYNRTYFEEEVLRFERERCAPVGMIVCDVDGLKLVNDTLGHNTGDALLVAAAGVIRETFRTSDMIARVGGDEFAVLLHNSDRLAVERASHRLRDNIIRYNSANPELPLSLSVGFAVDEVSIIMDDLYKKADNNMYQEKLHHRQSVRNAIV